MRDWGRRSLFNTLKTYRNENLIFIFEFLVGEPNVIKS